MSFIVIEGLDGSGKSTQIDLLKKYFYTNNIDFEFLHFPITDSPIFGEMVAKFLRGEFGTIDQVNPYLVALLYAGDRNNAANKIRQWLNEEKLVLTDRYVYSNIAYQCAKINNHKEKEELYNWILKMEYEYFKIPKPDISIFLDVPFDFIQKNLKEKRTGTERDYLKGKKDIHEASLDFQRAVKETYIKAIERDESFVSIKCFDEQNNILSPKEILNKLVSIILNKSFI
ncbi:MAG TPA: dTMP kinase [Bacteroidales bacterium]|jgi:dTMP kinase|nr:dTMP kinase [Bacteroidales bacterium]MDY0159795.1 dTMP kinase [Bacteroidales bacterium]HXK80725.1 dTMP kinase [Bacteroidales bacterium]